MVTYTGNIMIDRENMIIYVDQKARQFLPNGRRDRQHGHTNLFFSAVCHLILNGWTRQSDLFDFLYGADPDGGPLGGPIVLDPQVVQWNGYLRPLGLIIHRDKRGGTRWLKIDRICDVKSHL